MTSEAQAVLETIRTTIDAATRPLARADYEEVIGELEADCKGKLDALEEDEAGEP